MSLRMHSVLDLREVGPRHSIKTPEPTLRDAQRRRWGCVSLSLPSCRDVAQCRRQPPPPHTHTHASTRLHVDLRAGARAHHRGKESSVFAIAFPSPRFSSLLVLSPPPPLSLPSTPNQARSSPQRHVTWFLLLSLLLPQHSPYPSAFRIRFLAESLLTLPSSFDGQTAATAARLLAALGRTAAKDAHD